MNHLSLNGHSFTPNKIICVVRNYALHAAELNHSVPDQPAVFLKPNSAISTTVRTHPHETIHYEAEICFVVHNNQLGGVGLGLDLTKRALQSKLKQSGLPWERAKAFDGSAVFSEFVTYSSDISLLRMELWINDKLKQSGGVIDMVSKPQSLLADVSSFMTLLDGDILMTGTPAGVGPLCAGDTYTGRLFSGDQQLLQTQWTVLEASAPNPVSK